MLKHLLTLTILTFVFHSATSQIKNHTKISNSYGIDQINNLSDGDNFGRSVVNIGDLDDDGVDDLAVGANKSSEGGFGRGSVHILFMNSNGTIKCQSKISDLDGNFTGILDNEDIFGTSLAELGDLDGDGVEDLAVGARLDDDGATDAGAVWILFLKKDGTVKSSSKISKIDGGFTGPTHTLSSLGGSMASLNDLDGDGNTDIIVGANRDNAPIESKTGSAYILFLNSDGTVKSHQQISEGSAGFSGDLDFEDHFGSSVGNIGDIDEDGVVDVAVGATFDDDAGTNAGAFYVILLNSDGTVKDDIKITTGLQGFVGTIDVEGRFGSAVALVGDQNNDGANEFIIGNFRANDNGDTEGAIWLLSIDSNVDVVAERKISSSSSDFNPNLLSPDAFFGVSLANIGDFNDDGLDDLMVGAAQDDDLGTELGSSWLFNFNTDGTINSHSKISNSNGLLELNELADGDSFGRSVINIGDLDDDGVNDYAIGANRSSNDGLQKGSVHILFMNADGTIKCRRVISNSQGGFTGTINDQDIFGTSLAGLGDLDGDGIEDMAVGARLDDDGAIDAGAVWILFLDKDGTVKSHQKISNLEGGFTGTLGSLASFGSSLVNIGDLDLDGNDDLVVGANRDDSPTVSKSGSAYILFLNADGTVKFHEKIADGLNGFSGDLDFEDHFGTSVGNIGDIDNDGVSDIAIGATFDDDANANAGAFYIALLNNDGTVKSDFKITTGLQGFNSEILAEGRFGSSFANVGDLNGDGVTEYVVGNFRDNENGNSEGAIWLLSINSDVQVISEKKISSSSPDFDPTLSGDAFFGVTVANVGDVDLDGYDDIIIGASEDDDTGVKLGSIFIMNLTDCIAIAGDDQQLACDSFEASLNASATTGTGEWSIIEGQGTFSNVNSASTEISDLAAGSNILLWTVTNDNCEASDTLEITTSESLEANAGEDQNLCEKFETTLIAATPLEGVGEWSVILGNGSVANIENDTTLVSNLETGENIFQWTVTNGSCVSTDQVLVSVLENDTPQISQELNILTSTEGVSYQWFFNGDSIQNETAQTFEIETGGVYQVAVSYENGCIKHSEEYEASVITDIVESKIVKEFFAYPNPANSKINIDFRLQAILDYTLSLTNMKGQIVDVKTGNNDHIMTNFNTSSLQGGIYFLKLKLNNEEFVYKIVIKH